MKNIKLISCIIAVLFTLTLSALALSGTGTEADPYLVSTPADIALMHNDLDGYYLLTADIDMVGVDFEPIGNENEGAFTGTVDGDGHTISNLDINLPGNKYVGFVGYLEGTVKNLNLENVDACGYMYVGGLVGYVQSNGLITNCSVSGKICAKYLVGVLHVGGIIGFNDGMVTQSNGFVRIDEIESGNISTYVGGIVGSNNGLVSVCINSGSIAYSSGGIIGLNSGSVEECINKGSFNTGSIGGIAYQDRNGIIKNCTNYSNISSSSVCGIVYVISNTTIQDCTNYGELTGTNTVGGIAGYTPDYKTNNLVEDCINYGTLHGATVGGIMFETRSADIVSCVNYGDINGTTVGGILAISKDTNYSSYSTNIVSCFNAGEIFSIGFPVKCSVGGIVGEAEYEANLNIESCFNMGRVFGTSDGSEGWLGSTGSTYVGGIIGQDRGSDNYISNSINYGVLEGKSDDTVYISMISDYNVKNCLYFSPIIINDIDGDYFYKFIYSGGIGMIETALNSNENSLFYNAFKDVRNFKVLDFEEIWYIDSNTNSGFPQLRNMPRHIDLNECVLLLKVGESDKLEAFIDGVPESVIWSSGDEDIATVSADGTVTAIATGDIMITATNDEGMKMNCLVHITKDVSSVSLNKTETQIISENSETLTYTLNPVDANEAAIWSSSDESIATVSQSGVVTAKTIGTATITVTTVTSNKSASCEVTVVGAPITSVSIPSSASVNVGSTKKLSLTIKPELYAGTILWSSSDETIATVSQDGTVTGHKAGNTVITVKSDTGYTSTCTVTVKIPATAITINKTELTLETGFTEKLVATLEPADSTDTVSWSTSNSSYVTVASDGTITAKNTYSGTITITATTTSGLKAYCYVKVIAAKVPVSSVTLDNTELIMTKADTKQLKATVLPDNATNKTLVWTTSDEGVATVSNTGVVTAVGDGTAIIRAESNNGMYHECVVKVISASGPSIVLDGAKASPGGKAVVKANIVKNPGISAYKFTLKYDKSRLTPVKAVGNAEFGGSFSDNIDDVLNGKVLECVYTIKADGSVTYHSSGVTVNSVNSDGFSGTTVNNNGLLHFKDSIEVDVTNVKQVVVRAQIPKGERLEIFYLKEGMTDFAQTYSARITTDSDEMKDYVFDLSADENFTGMITGFRIDPTSNVGVDFRIESVKFMGLASLDKSEINVLWYSTQDVDIDGELFTVEFAASGDVVYGDSTDVQILYSGTDICNTNGDFLALYTKNATVEFKEPMPGDVYEDEDVNVYDLTLEARYITALETFTARQKEAGDINNDLLVDIKDVVGLSQYIVGWSDAELMDETVAKTGNSVISLGTAKVNSLGEAEIPVYITNNAGFAGFNFKLEYDEEKVEILSITPNTKLIQGDFITNIGSIDERGLLVTWYQNDNITADGLLFTVKAKLVDGVDVACVSIVPANNNMCDENKANVESEYTEGYVLRDKYVRSEVITAEGKTFCNLYFDGSFEEQSATAIVAFYDGIKLSQTKIVPVTVKAGKVEVPLENVTSNYTSYKVFVWKDAEKFIPMVEAK